MLQDIPSYIKEIREKILNNKNEFSEKDLQLIDNLELSYNFIDSKLRKDLMRVEAYYENSNGR
jgi:hypothetical protein